jgi:hypothetical protein
MRPAWVNSSEDPISKIPNTKQGWWSGSSSRMPTYQVQVQTLVPLKKTRIRYSGTDL